MASASSSWTWSDGLKFSLFSWRGLGLLALIYCCCQVIRSLGLAIYNIWFHPLRHIPGPKLWIAFNFPRHIAVLRGTVEAEVRGFHEHYGDVVRSGPSQVTFTTAQAWRDIYGRGHEELPKYYRAGLATQNTPKMIIANRHDHFRYRRALLPGFSDRALRQQEPIIKNYIDLLIGRLRDFAISGQKTNMVLWYNLTTFDLIGDLAFGESFNGLKNLNAHFWVNGFDKMLQAAVTMFVLDDYPLLNKIIMFFVAGTIRMAQQAHQDNAKGLARKRIENKAQQGRGDFMDALVESRGQKHGLNDDELVSVADLLILAGSETTATLLSGVTYWLLRTPDAMNKVTTEVRSAFDNEDDITFVNASAKLPYTLACLDEALRLYPPVPGALARRTNPGPPTQISGYSIPENTSVAVHHTAAYWSPVNFHQPKSFIPERWLPESTENPSSPFYKDNRDVRQPFHIGPRNCVGKNLAYHEMRLILARVLWNFDLELCGESQNWTDQRTFALWAKKPLMCTLRVRPDAKV